MNIVVVNDRLYPDFIGGVEKRNHDLAAALADRGHSVTLVGFGCGPSALSSGVKVHSLGPLGPLYNGAGRRSTIEAFRFAWRVFRLDLSPFDVVEASNIPYVHLLPLALRCRMQHRPLLVTWYEYWGPYWRTYVGERKAPVYRLGEWLTAQLGTGVVATSDLTARRLAARRFGSSEVAIVPCGVAAAEIRMSGSDRPAGAPLVYAGRLIREKRLDLLFAALRTVPDWLDARLVVFGEGPEREALQTLAVRMGIASRVEFQGHAEDAAEVWRTIGAARIAVQPSSREGFGLFPLEAMTLGLPVICCNSADSALPELVRDGVEGLCCDASPESLGSAIERLLTDEALRARLGAAAKLRAAQFDRAHTSAQIESHLLRLVDHARQARGRRRTADTSIAGSAEGS